MLQCVILRTALDDFYPSAELVDSSSTERVRLRKNAWTSLQSLNRTAL